MPVPVVIDPESAGKGVDTIERVLNLLNTPLQKVKTFVTSESIAHFKIGFREFLETSYNRCKYYKSILSKSPVNILNSYTNIYLNGDGDVNGGAVLDEDLIAKIFEKKYLVITGNAGGGKSMFMRFLTMKIFYEHGDKIPIFLELRKLNEQSEADLIEFIYDQCSPKGHFVTVEQFSKAIKAGGIVFIFDGFDELNFDIRDKIQKQILDIQKNYPNASVIVSSRHDDRFSGWSNYHEYSVENLNKYQCLDLISKLVIDNDGGVKSRFYKAVDVALYDTHETFLSSPLLITIMLFTYEGDGDVPSKMHEFYGSAYDVLFQRHDATKEQYVRKKYTQLSKDDFAICFSAFCALSYRSEKFEFDEDLLNSYSDRAIRYANSCGVRSNLLTVANFKLDMVESICLLQLDGKYWSFVHRSFQEYFSAKFLSKLDDVNAKKLLNELNLRRMDNVFSLLFEIDKEKMQRIWVIPNIDILNRKLKLRKRISSKFNLFFNSMYFSRLQVYSDDRNQKKMREIFEISLSLNNINKSDEDYFYIMLNILKLYGKYSYDEMTKGTAVSFNNTFNKKSFSLMYNKIKGGRYDNTTKILDDFINRKVSRNYRVSVVANSENEWLVTGVGYGKYIQEVILRLSEIDNSIKSNMQLKISVLDEIM